MNERHRLPEVPATALRDQGTSERLDRIWKRLEHDLAGSRSRGRRTFEWAWAPAAVAIVFLSGLFTGLSWRQADRATSTSFAPEPIGPAENPLHNPERPGQAQGERTRPAQPPRKPRPPAPNRSAAEIDLRPPAVVGVAPIAVDPGPPDWQRVWLEEQDAERAVRAIEHRGGFDQVLAQASSEQLMILVNIAQAVGDQGRAVAALRRAVEHYPRDPAAPQAAFMLGVALEKAGDRAGAAQAFATCRALSPQSEIAEDALARQIEAALEQSDLSGARQLVDQYEREFPQGGRLAEFRTALGKISALTGAASAAPSAGIAAAPAPAAGPQPPPQQ